MWWKDRRQRDHAHAPPTERETQSPAATVFARSTLQAPGVAGSGFKVRVANRARLVDEAALLLNRRYRDRGYGTQAVTLSDELLTIAIYEQDQLVGTLTVSLDQRGGLLGEAHYAQELTALRAAGARLCAFTKLATGERASASHTLATMFHVAFIYAHQLYRATHVVIEVNPRHVGFYTRVLGFKRCGPPRHNPGIGAPGVLLVCPLSHIEAQIHAARSAAGPHGAKPGRPSFFAHSLSQRQEQRTRERMRVVLQSRRMGATGGWMGALRRWWRGRQRVGREGMWA